MPPRRLFAATIALLALPLLAGCLGVDPASPLGEPANAPDAPDALEDLEDLEDAPPVSFGAPELVGPGGDAETSLTIGPDGTMLACTHGGFRKPSPLWMSEDGGGTWTRMNPRPNPVPSGDCDVAVGDDGQIYMMYDTVASATVAASEDRGASWTVNPAAALPAGGVDRPWIAAGPGDTLYLLYQNVAVAEPAVDLFAKSTDGGATWTEHQVVSTTEPPEKSHDIAGDMLVSEDGETIRAPLLRWNDVESDSLQTAPKHLAIATSQDGGSSWTVENVAGPRDAPIQIPKLSRAGDGTLYLSLTMTNGSTTDITFLRSTDDGQTWSDPVTVATGYQFPGVAAAWVDGRPDGSATMAWMHRNDSGWQVSAARVDGTLDDPAVWVGNLTPRRDVSQIFEFIMVDHDPEGRAHVVYPMAGDGCARPPLPGDNRNQQCIKVVSEAASGGG